MSTGWEWGAGKVSRIFEFWDRTDVVRHHTFKWGATDLQILYRQPLIKWRKTRGWVLVLWLDILASHVSLTILSLTTEEISPTVSVVNCSILLPCLYTACFRVPATNLFNWFNKALFWTWVGRQYSLILAHTGRASGQCSESPAAGLKNFASPWDSGGALVILLVAILMANLLVGHLSPALRGWYAFYYWCWWCCTYFYLSSSHIFVSSASTTSINLASVLCVQYMSPWILSSGIAFSVLDLDTELSRSRMSKASTVLQLCFILFIALAALDYFIPIAGDSFIPSRRAKEPYLPYELSLVDTKDFFGPVAAE